MSYPRYVLPLLVLVGAVCGSASAQDASCLNRTLSVTVSGAGWRLKQGLVPSDFRGKYRGKPVQIVSLATDDRSRRIVILLDVSGSMNAAEVGRKWPLAWALALHISETAMPNTRLALLIFNEKIVERIDFAQGNAAVAKRLQQIAIDKTYSKSHIKGRTALRDTILEGLHILESPTMNDSIYVITDGGDNASRHGQQEVLRAFIAAGIRLFASLITLTTNTRLAPPEEFSGPHDLKELIRATGGYPIAVIGTSPFGVPRFNFDSQGRQALAAAASELYRLMTENMRMTVRLPDPPDKWRHWELRLSEQREREWKGAQITYPTELPPCQ